MTDRWSLYVDACCPGNPGPAAAGGVLTTPDRGQAWTWGKRLGEMTNNEAEYRALLVGLGHVAKLGVAMANVQVYADSQLMVRQLGGRYAVASERLRPLWQEARRLGGDAIAYTWIPRERNAEADALANEALAKGDFVGGAWEGEGMAAVAELPADMDEQLRALDDRLTRGDEWIKAEREALTALYRAGQHEDEAWEKRAVRFFRQECKWYALWDEYLALRDKEAWARKSETEKAWDALRSDFPINAKPAGPQLVPHKRERAINV